MTSIAQAIGQEYEKKGMQQGMQQGMQEGMQEEKLHIAKNMLSKGFASNLIQELSGISEEEFRQLEKTYSADK
jgi:predicted transposase/invertase (TIGR01784 family)